MGCDIHTQAERKVNGNWEIIPGLSPFDWRQYGMYGFLANVRNYSAVPPISEPRGLPDDVVLTDDREFFLGDHSHSWLSVEELLAFDYDAEMEDRRVTAKLSSGITSGACTAPLGYGEAQTWREFLRQNFFDDLAKLKDAGAERVVFGFDS
jgi:hypothetical protein